MVLKKSELFCYIASWSSVLYYDHETAQEKLGTQQWLCVNQLAHQPHISVLLHGNLVKCPLLWPLTGHSFVCGFSRHNLKETGHTGRKGGCMVIGLLTDHMVIFINKGNTRFLASFFTKHATKCLLVRNFSLMRKYFSTCKIGEGFYKFLRRCSSLAAVK